MMRKASLLSSYAAASITASGLPSTRRITTWACAPACVRHREARGRRARPTACATSVRSLDSNGGHGAAAFAGEEHDDEPGDHDPTNAAVRSRSLDWIRRVVVGYNFCPFAGRPLREGRLRVSVVRGDDDEHVAAAVAWELVARSDAARPGTTVVVAPDYRPSDFEGYMLLVQRLQEDVVEEHGLEGLVQIAPFHPRFEFAGSGPEGVDNFTNRSPYPMFHILRCVVC